MSYENSNNEFSSPQYSLPSPLGHEKSFRENSVEFTTSAFENGALTAPLEIPSCISQPVDDYSLHHIFLKGSQYCANLRKRNCTSLEEGNPRSNYMKPIPPVFIEQGNPNPNKLYEGWFAGGTGESLVGAHNNSSSLSTYPGIDRYKENLEAFLRESPHPRQIEGECMGVEKSAWTLMPKYYNDELKEVSKEEYWMSLQSKKSKDMSNLGVSTQSMSALESWSAQVYRDSQASNTISMDLNGTHNWMQTSNISSGGFYNNGIQQGGENQTFQIYENNFFTEQSLQTNSNTSLQLHQGCQNSELETNLARFNAGNGNGMENGSGNGLEKESGEGSFVMLDNEEDYAAIWEDLNPLEPMFDDGDCHVLPDSHNKEFENHGYQSQSCTNQVIDIGRGQKVGENSSDDFVNGFIISEGNPNPPQSTMGKPVEGLDLLKQDQNEEVSLGTSEWTDHDFLFATQILRDDSH